LIIKYITYFILGSPRRSESCLLTLMRKILDSPGESDIYNVAANVRTIYLVYFFYVYD